MPQFAPPTPRVMDRHYTPVLELLLLLPLETGMYYYYYSAFNSRLGKDVSVWGNLDYVPIPLALREAEKATLLCGSFQLLLRKELYFIKYWIAQT